MSRLKQIREAQQGVLSSLTTSEERYKELNNKFQTQGAQSFSPQEAQEFSSLESVVDENGLFYQRQKAEKARARLQELSDLETKLVNGEPQLKSEMLNKLKENPVFASNAVSEATRNNILANFDTHFESIKDQIINDDIWETPVAGVAGVLTKNFNSAVDALAIQATKVDLGGVDIPSSATSSNPSGSVGGKGKPLNPISPSADAEGLDPLEKELFAWYDNPTNMLSPQTGSDAYVKRELSFENTPYDRDVELKLMQDLVGSSLESDQGWASEELLNQSFPDGIVTPEAGGQS